MSLIVDVVLDIAILCASHRTNKINVFVPSSLELGPELGSPASLQQKLRVECKRERLPEKAYPFSDAVAERHDLNLCADAGSEEGEGNDRLEAESHF